MLAFTVLALISLLGVSAAAPHYKSSSPSTTYTHPANGDCIDYTVSETVTSDNYIWAAPKFSNNFDVAGFLFNSARKDHASLPSPFSGTQNVTNTYEVEGTFCTPKTLGGQGKEKTVLLASHGLGYDRRYWAASFESDQYSFAQYALNKGYSVFYYDRLGTGKSQKTNPGGFINQATLQTSLLGAIATSIRSGKYTGAVKASKIVLVGHSFGSFISNAILAQDSSIAEGAVLTGIAYPLPNDTLTSANLPYESSVFALRIANQQSPAFADLDNGYLGFGDIYAHIETFFHQPNYSIPVAEYANSIAQPLAIAELITLFNLNLAAPSYKGKVLVTTGEFDWIMCGGECKSTFAEQGYKGVFSAASELETYLHSGSGHGVNLNNNATGFYEVITNFLDKSI